MDGIQDGEGQHPATFGLDLGALPVSQRPQLVNRSVAPVRAGISRQIAWTTPSTSTKPGTRRARVARPSATWLKTVIDAP